MQSLEIIVPPAGSLFGAGNGGIIHIESTPDFLHDQITSSFSVGSFGSWSTRLSARNVLIMDYYLLNMLLKPPMVIVINHFWIDVFEITVPLNTLSTGNSVPLYFTLN